MHHPLLYDLQIAKRVTRQAREQNERATVREREKEQGLRELEKGRDDAFMEYVKGREGLERLEKEKEEEEQEINGQIKASEVKERVWEEKRRYEEDKESMKMGRGGERENWIKQVKKLKNEKGEKQEELQLKIKKIVKVKEEEKQRWEREKEEDLRKQQRLDMEREER